MYFHPHEGPGPGCAWGGGDGRGRGRQAGADVGVGRAVCPALQLCPAGRGLRFLASSPPGASAARGLLGVPPPPLVSRHRRVLAGSHGLPWPLAHTRTVVIAQWGPGSGVAQLESPASGADPSTWLWSCPEGPALRPPLRICPVPSPDGCLWPVSPPRPPPLMVT